MNKGIPEGKGNLIRNGFVYTGTFSNGVRQGEGVLEIQDSSYIFSSVFVDDQPEFECNKFVCEVVGPKVEEAPVDTKAAKGKDAPKGQPAATAKFTEQEEATYGANKIFYEFKRAVAPAEGS